MADFIEHIRKLRVLLQNLVTRVVVDRSESNGSYQLLWGGGRVTSNVEHLETQGVHFRAPADAGGVMVNAGGVREAAVLIGVGGIVPNDVIEEGEGGLHYLSAWRLFLNADGQVCLGRKEPEDYAARAARVDAELAAIKADLDGFKTAFDTHTHPYVDTPAGPAVTAPPDSLPVPLGATAITFPAPHSPETVASQIVRLD